MRFVAGIIIGVLLTIGAAYVIDSVHTAPGPDGRQARGMINWDVVNTNMAEASTSVQDAWANLVGRSRQQERKNGV